MVDGGSGDATCALVRADGARVAHLVSEPDRGIYDAMNKGLALASGDLVGFLNTDDAYASEDSLSQVARVFEREPALDAVFGDVLFFDPARPGQPVRRYRSDRFSPARLGWGWMPAHPGMFVRRGIYREVGDFRIDYRIAGDFEWVARAFTRRTLQYRHLPEVLVRMQTGGVSTRGFGNSLLLNREVMRACRENGIATNWAKLLSKYPSKLTEFLRP